MSKFRIENDSFGEMKIEAEKVWGAQTQRSIMNFPIGWEKQPSSIIRALGVIKLASAKVNMAQGNLDPKLGQLIINAAKKVISAFEKLYVSRSSTITSLCLNLSNCPTLFFEATKKRSSNSIFDFSKISIVFLPTFPVAPIIAIFIMTTLFQF